MAFAFDSSYYLQQNPDVLSAVSTGVMPSAEYHFNNFGWKELRNPNSIFDTSDYLVANTDVLASGMNPLTHFIVHGAGESRAPSALFTTIAAGFDSANYLSNNTDVQAAVTAGSFTSAYQHWVLFGQYETGRPVAQLTDGTLVSTITSVVTGSTLALTTGVDNISGTSSNDTIDGSRSVTVAGVLDTINNSDSIDGGAGTDTLSVQLNSAASATTTLANLRNVEVISVENTVGGAVPHTLNLQNSDSAVTTIKTANNASGVVVSNIQSAPTAYTISTTGQSFTATVVNTALAGTADAATVTLSGVSAGTTTLGTVSAASGYETINVVSSGTTKNGLTADLVLDDALSTSLATVNISGATALDLDVTPTTVTTVNASTMTAALDLGMAANTNAMAVTGGTVNDIIDVGGYTSADTINGGTGTDKLVLTNAEATAATATQSNVSNIEVIGLSDTTNGTVIAVGNFGATGLQLGTAVDHTSNVLATFAAGTNSFDLQDSTDNGAETITLSTAGTATTDVMNVTFGTAAAAATWNGGGLFTISGSETVNITSQGAANTYAGAITLTDTAATQTLNILGSQSFTITGVATADVINASGMTSTAALVLTAGTAAATTITGSANADTLIGSTAADIISGGAGADFIANRATGAAVTAGDVLTGGAGFDTFTLIGSSASAANYNGAPNITDFTVGSTATTTDLIRLSSFNADTDDTAGFSTQATGGGATGTVGVQNVAQNASAAAVSTGAEFFKLTTGVAFTTDLQGTFNAAIGSATITGTAATSTYAASFYDTTNSKMVIVEVLNTANVNTTIETGDAVRLVGTIDMTASDYALIDTDNFAAFLA